MPFPGAGEHAQAGVESGHPADHRLLRGWQEVPDTAIHDNGFKVQWEMFIRHVAEDAPWPHTLLEGAKGVQLAEAGLRSWKERRWVDLPELRI